MIMCVCHIRMTIERAFGKFKQQWRLFSSTLPRYYPTELGAFLQAAFVLHNVSIDIDGPPQDDEQLVDPHSSREIFSGDEATSLRTENFASLSRQEKVSARAGKNLRNSIKDYLEMFIKE